jgi:Protein of unknown function (DUF3141)
MICCRSLAYRPLALLDLPSRLDAAQRSVLFWDVMRLRGNAYLEHLAEAAPHVLDYEVELVPDGRTFERPVNYALVRIVPPQGVELDVTRRPSPGPLATRAASGIPEFDELLDKAKASSRPQPGKH